MEKENDKMIPKISRKINDFLYEEEGNISRGKIITVGSLMLIAGLIFADEVFGAHRSHSSHKSHSSHSSHSSGSGGHASHSSHSSHSSSTTTHSSHSSSSTTHSSSSTSATTQTETLPTFQNPQIPPNTPAIQ